ncbi:MAG: DUF6524 family protein [Pseudomonadota bacterium]
MSDRKTSNNGPSAGGFLIRLFAALLLVFLTYNPSGESAYHWVSAAVSASAFGPVHLILVAVLLIGWSVYWIATWRALGTLGVTLAAVLLAGIIWLLMDIGLLEAASMNAVIWIGLVSLSVILAVGVYWSHIWRRITGQINVEDVDD